ncbi:hypothetical protein INR49_023154, partial [Caranx melampygus]
NLCTHSVTSCPGGVRRKSISLSTGEPLHRRRRRRDVTSSAIRPDQNQNQTRPDMAPWGDTKLVFCILFITCCCTGHLRKTLISSESRQPRVDEESTSSEEEPETPAHLRGTSATMAQIAIDCCLSVKDKAVNKFAFVDYSQQVGGMGCAIDATVLVGKLGKSLCVPPNAAWVQDVVKHVNHLRKVCKTNPQKKRCSGVKTK